MATNEPWIGSHYGLAVSLIVLEHICPNFRKPYNQLLLEIQYYQMTRNPSFINLNKSPVIAVKDSILTYTAKILIFDNDCSYLSLLMFNLARDWTIKLPSIRPGVIPQNGAFTSAPFCRDKFTILHDLLLFRLQKVTTFITTMFRYSRGSLPSLAISSAFTLPWSDCPENLQSPPVAAPRNSYCIAEIASPALPSSSHWHTVSLPFKSFGPNSFSQSKLSPAFGNPITDNGSALRNFVSVELRRHHAGKTMRWVPWIVSKDNGAVAQILRE